MCCFRAAQRASAAAHGLWPRRPENRRSAAHTEVAKGWPNNSSVKLQNSRTATAESSSSVILRSACSVTKGNSTYSNYCLHQGGPACELTIAKVEEQSCRIRPRAACIFRNRDALRLPLAWLRIRHADRQCVADRKLKLRKYQSQKGMIFMSSPSCHGGP